MANTPADAPPRFAAPTAPATLEASGHEIVELLRKALEPSFILVRQLGAGGMGVVYLARDPALKRMVAVKVMSPERAHDPDARARFQREAEAVAKISHPNVVAVYSVGELANGIPYLVMQYVEGRSMAERLAEEGPLEVEEAKVIIGQVAAALAAAHAKGIVHRDIKAANILWDDASARALVSDFGIAALLEHREDGDTMALTKTGMVVGTPRYMSPEQLLAERVSDKSDVYSLGLLGYDLLAREGPFPVTSPNQLIVAHLRDAPRPLSTLRSDVDPAFDALLTGCLEKDPHARPTAEDIARRLQHSVSVVLEWPPPGLEDLQGALGRTLQRLLGGAAAIAIPLTIVATTTRDSALRPDWPGILLLPIVAAMGAVSVLLAGVELAKLTRMALRAARAGYPWGVIAEIMVDTEKDMGALITGDREYAALGVAARTDIRRWRVMRAALRGAAALWLLGGFFVALPIAVRVGGGSLFAAISLGIPAALLAVSRVLQWRESRLLAPIRARMRRHHAALDRLSQLAATWRDAFERVVPGLSRATETAARVGRRAAAVVALGAAAVVAVVGAGAFLATAVGGVYFEEVQTTDFGSVRDKANAVVRLRSERAAVDPSITPAQAGVALQAITMAGRPTPSSPSQVAPRIALPSIALPASLDSKFIGGGNVVRLAREGRLSPGQRDALRTAAALPGAAEFTTLSRARVADWLDVMLAKPAAPIQAAFGLPLLRYTNVKVAGQAHIARAAVAAEQGRLADAERLLREVIGAGFVLMEGPNALENLVGIVLVRMGRDELVSLYEITGRADQARRISAAADPVRDEAVPVVTPRNLDPETRERVLTGLIRDESAPRGVRWEIVVSYLAFQPCNDLGQVLFGPDESYRTQLAAARKALVRTPGEERLMDITDRTLETPVDNASLGVPESLTYRSFHAFARTVDAITGSKRMEACMAVRPVQ
ncbi:MAG TPA: serine/threonine-protein kinase [Gemmatimonadaceae bacterium]|nr:serine/threonine-protein kinase [Gemmatimonadaceae bacterium]